jgi:ABC-type phosphate/phosphonate transport system substrate-binding protein
MILFRIVAFILIWAAGFSPAFSGSRDLVVVRPGGPSASEEAGHQVTRLVREIAVRAGWPPEAVQAFYFNRAEDALAHIAANRPGFILTTPGFYLAQRTNLSLEPLNQVLLDGRDTHRYHIVVCKERGAATLDGLKGKTLAGAPITEADFVERVVLGGRFDFGTDITVSSGRALSSLRQLCHGDLDAVILDDTEHGGLASLPFAGELNTVWSSAPLPNTGIFAVSGMASPGDAKSLLAATADFCSGEEGSAICETYGITGFRTVPEGVFDAVIAQYGPPEGAP